MASQRYLDLLATLQQWRTNPPLTEPPSLKPDKRARRAQRKADRRLTEAIESGDDAMLHRARKAAKRARYAAELRAPLDKRAKKTVKHYKQIQTVLGDHQDGVVASDVCADWPYRGHDARARTASPTACCMRASNRPPRHARTPVRELLG